MAKKIRTYSDIDLRFQPQVATKDVSMSYDEQAVIRSVRNLISTNLFERPFKPNLGSTINNLLFEPISPITATLIEEEIKRTVENYEPRATIASINVISSPDENAYTVSVYFYIGNNTEPTGINILLKRAR